MSMRVAVVGSRDIIRLNLAEYLPDNTTEIISGGARGVDSIARRYAIENDIPLTEFLPEYERYGRSAPLYRNQDIVDNADFVLAFWDGLSPGTRNVVHYCTRIGKPMRVVYLIELEEKAAARGELPPVAPPIRRNYPKKNVKK